MRVNHGCPYITMAEQFLDGVISANNTINFVKLCTKEIVEQKQKGIKILVLT